MMRGICLLLMLLGPLSWKTSAQETAHLKVGASQVDITPAPGTPMAGYYHERAAEDVHDPLFAKALVLDDGRTRIALVALDLISTTRDLVAESRALIEQAIGIPPPCVMISATHAHTGPILSGRGARDDAFGADHPLARKYRENLPALICKAVQDAVAQTDNARTFKARGEESSIAFNRRFHMTDGSVGWNPGKLNPRIIKPAGTIDPEVPFLHFETIDEQRKPIATYLNYAVHLDNIGGAHISADMPGVVSRLLAEYKGPEQVTVFTAGCCGDVNHIDVNWRERQSGFENAARMGVILTAEVLRAWPSLTPVETTDLQVASEQVLLELPQITPEETQSARALVDRFQRQTQPVPPFLEIVNAFKVLDVADRQGKPYEAEVQVITLGDEVAWVALPGEIFVELGLAIKQDSPFPMTIIAELANGSIGYIPSRRAYSQGNYEVVSARCAEGSGERLVDAAVRTLNQLHKSARERTSAN